MNEMAPVFNAYGIMGVFILIAAKEFVYVMTRKKDKERNGSVYDAVNAVGDKFAGVDFRQIQEDVKWMREAHAATDTSGRLRWYDNTSELKEVLKELNRCLMDLSLSIRDNNITSRKLHDCVESLELKVERLKVV